MGAIEKMLKPTNDINEQIEIGKKLVVAYDETMVTFINGIIEKAWKQNDCKLFGGILDKEGMFYKSAYDYWMYGFRPDQQFYYRLWEKSHEEKSTFLSEMKEMIYDARCNKMDDFHYLEDKFEAYELLKPYYKREIIKLTSEEDYPKFLDFISRHPSFVFKPMGLHDTYGVDKVDTKEVKDLKALFESFLGVAGNYKDDYTTDGYYHSGAVLEEIIEQDSEFGVMSPKSLNGVRIGTLRANGKVHFIGAWLKMGVTDNLIVGESRDALMAGINCQTGVVETNGYYESGKIVAEHPVSMIPFIGFKIPKWDEMLEMMTKAAGELMPTINYVGWDVVLTPKGWVVIEGNFYGQQLWQVVYEKGTEKEFGDIIGWHIEEGKYWWQYSRKKMNKEAGLI